jgi:hypothetical protein
VGFFALLMISAEHKRVQMIWLLGHGDRGKDVTATMAKQRFETPFIGLEPAYGISNGAVR